MQRLSGELEKRNARIACFMGSSARRPIGRRNENSQFDCPGRRRTSCRLCLKAPHRPVTCAKSEAQQMRDNMARILHVVTEAMLKAHVCRYKYVYAFGIPVLLFLTLSFRRSSTTT